MLKAMKLRILPLALLLAGCASSAVDMEEPKRLLGREENVRIDAEISSDRISNSSNIGLTWEIQNFRDQAIAVADLVAQTAYDPESRTITVTLGSEVPGLGVVPRLIVINPGEKKTFSGGARASFVLPMATGGPVFPRDLRIRLNYLRDVEPFRVLVGISERAVVDEKLADQLFPLWVENNDSVTTNAVPISWLGRQEPVGSRRRPFFD
jgi:hypothetical protein